MVTSNTIIFVILIAKHSILTDFQMFREQIKNSVAYIKCILFISNFVNLNAILAENI